MSPLPVQMRDRWASRREPPEGKGTVYWHVLMSRYPEVRAAATASQDALRDIPGLHFTPDQWFHMTLQLVGSTDDIGRGQMDDMLQNVRRVLDHVPPLDASVGRVLYHPEAIMLAVEPVEKLRSFKDLVRTATSSSLGWTDRCTTDEWVPHVTVAYSTAGQPAERVISALSKSTPTGRFVLNRVSLVVQWGPERNWNWDEVGDIGLRL